MKKILIVLIILFPILAFSQMSKHDSVPLLLIKINPVLMISQKDRIGTIGGIVEYHFKKYFSVEAGGEVNSDGFTIRAGLKFYSTGGTYFSPVIVYRNNQYNDRSYFWNRDMDLSPISETSTFPSLFGSGADCYYIETADETKQVFCMQALWGKQRLLGNEIPFEYYWGFGVRYKYREKEISYHYDNCGNWSHNYAPAKEELVQNYLPSFQAGVRIGLSLKTSKLAYNQSKRGRVDWKDVIITYNKNDTIGLMKAGEVSEPYYMDNKKSLDKAMKELRKETAKLGCRVVLIPQKMNSPDHTKNNVIILTGIAYSH